MFLNDITQDMIITYLINILDDTVYIHVLNYSTSSENYRNFTLFMNSIWKTIYFNMYDLFIK